ncbi:helix-turn-helix domain-containing protein [Cytophaga hutchinsonii]|jgi:transcriptional regulator with XRE-family HTH domain|uniref:HTH cro/C1-type domain-containing protein n=1 Tax=Cytophaga hutchinsonii (strain ATCC 33406 / DSM 1761 / CIP 103989 / NBRC 15051 / NCIMB 9469 / D465) TaxID=269798 RepID=A0A6N4SMR5_CYTH3|nr:helix-turn-helix transcriptional regulator [Cytophaga hutchinsonii]ABG57562.1 conserved hypothetical protein [Cytophaga hutchinsonii ATCC 33406]SFW99980.1 Helix-turn-helix domain-containing protein [Cytophaga hutchinsonii ATCC 33406]
MKSVNERIKFLIEELNLNSRAFSLKLGVDPTIIHNIISGRMSMPSYVVLEKIVLTFDNVNAKWLLTGKGEKYTRAAESVSMVNDPLPVYEKSAKEISLENEIINLKGQIEAYKNVITSLSAKQ